MTEVGTSPEKNCARNSYNLGWMKANRQSILVTYRYRCEYFKIIRSPYGRILIGGSAQTKLNNNNKQMQPALTDAIMWSLHISTPKPVLSELLSTQTFVFFWGGGGLKNTLTYKRI